MGGVQRALKVDVAGKDNEQKLGRIQALNRSAKNRAPAAAPGHKLNPEQISTMITEHLEVGKRLAWSFLGSWRIRMNSDEVISIVGASLCEAAHRFDPTKGVSFKTFLFYYLRGMLLKEITRIVNDRKVGDALAEESLAQYKGNIVMLNRWPFALIEQNNPERLLERRQLSYSCWKACSKLDSLEREVVYRHFVCDESLKEIAASLGYCRCHISRVKSTALEKLESLLESSVESEGGGSSRQASLLLSRLTADLSRKRGYKGGRGRSKAKKRFDENLTLTKMIKQVRTSSTD